MSRRMKAQPYRVGQVLYFAASEQRHREHRHGQHEFEVTITAVGRRWLTVKPGVSNATSRIDIDTLAVDGGQFTSPGRCYRSPEARAETAEARRLWVALRRAVSDAPTHLPGNVDSHALRRVFGILGLTEPEDMEAPSLSCGRPEKIIE
jgi:hypothetical protein